MRSISFALTAMLLSSLFGCDGGSLPPDLGDESPTSTSPRLDLRGVVSIPSAMAITDGPIELTCSFEFASDRNVFTYPNGLTNLRTACETCEANGQECWARDTDPGPNASWAQICLTPGMTLLEAHNATNTILCDQFAAPAIREQCATSATAHPPYRIGRYTPVCVPAGAGYSPGDVQFKFEKCGIAGVPPPQNDCCRETCIQGSPDFSAGESGEPCVCIL